MIDIDIWMHGFLRALRASFGDRVWFAGLQGSYARREASETSDIDTVVNLDALNAADIQLYNRMLDSQPNREKICGFISGKSEIMNWEAADLFQFYHDTQPVIGSLDELLPLIDESALKRAIHTGACNIYHGCVHNMLHEKSEEILKGLYKSASFVVQAVCFQKTGRYFSRQQDLLEFASLDEINIIKTFLSLKGGEDVAFQEMSESLFNWCRTLITES